MALPSSILALTLTAASAEAGEVWDKRIDDASNRFKVLSAFGDEAVLDRETGLVWERHVGDREEPDVQQVGWHQSTVHCLVRQTGGRGGWRLPSVEELYSLVDRRYSNPALLPGHPFLNVHSSAPYWTATTAIEAQSVVLSVAFASGLVGNTLGKAQDSAFTWCVRGGKGFDGVQ